jgi:hypothetical protein
MEEARLDNEIKRIQQKFSFLWINYGFHLRYFTRDYGMYNKGFIIGIENNICKLVFEKETNSLHQPIAISVGKLNSSFTPPNYSYYAKYGWYPLVGLIYWLTGIECERDKIVDQDLELVSEYLKIHTDRLFDLFKSPDEFDGKIEYYRNLYKENQLTVEKIRAERARLHALGLDSSLESAITNLRGGKK